MSSNSCANNNQPLIPASTNLPELTFKVFVLSILLAVLLAAANVYLALKIGLTISASIPASVLAISILRFFKNSNVLECNIIQTSASAGEGVAAAVAYVLPALIILHFWQSFPYWETTLLTTLGGVLGVLFSIPLRRVLLHLPTLRFPEGTAIGNILKVSTKGGQHIQALSYGSFVGALVSFAQTGLKLVSDTLPVYLTSGSAVFGLALGFNPATVAAGFIVGIEVGISLLVGVLIGWVVLLPILSSHYGIVASLSNYDNAMTIWTHHLRFVGVGTMVVGGIWTLIRLLKPVINGLQASFRSLRAADGSYNEVPRTERDVPIHWVLVGIGVCAILVYILLFKLMVAADFPYGNHFLLFAVLCTTVYVIIVGSLLATVCGYITGLIGSSNNPLSGLTIVGILFLGIIFLFLFKLQTPGEAMKATALVIVVMTIVATAATISNENIQDLKAGYMIGATPWKQQFILAVGAVVSALIMAPVLDLLLNAYGIGGIFPRSGMNPAQMLTAPQAGLMAAVAKGVLTHQLDWNMIYIGCGVAAVVIVIDEYLKTKGHRLPALAVGLGIYLPPEVMLPMTIGGFINYAVRRKMAPSKEHAHKEDHEKLQNGVLLASGLVAGSAIMGVVLAIPFVIFGSADVLSIMPPALMPVAQALGLVVLVGLCWWMYRVCVRASA